LMQAKRNMKKKIKHFTLIGLAAWCSFNPESPNRSSRYRELHNQAQALRQGKAKMQKKKVRLFTLTRPAAWWSFNRESHNSSSRYRELHNQAQALMQARKSMKKNIKPFTITGPAT
jgi:hypothetical protein